MPSAFERTSYGRCAAQPAQRFHVRSVLVNACSLNITCMCASERTRYVLCRRGGSGAMGAKVDDCESNFPCESTAKVDATHRPPTCNLQEPRNEPAHHHGGACR